MFVVRVLPISRGVFKDSLTFFSRTDVPEGALVFAPIRGKNTPALVLSSTDVREEKTEIRSAQFTLKKISAENAKRVLSRAFIESMKHAAVWHGAHESSLLSVFTSQVILTAGAKLAGATDTKNIAREALQARPDLLVLQAEREERVRTYRNLAREAFARDASLLVLAPTVIEAETLKKELERGIEDRVVLLTSELPKKKLIENWNICATSAEPILIVGTAFALSVPCEHIDTLIVERESARAYRGIARPHADLRRAAEAVCLQSGSRLILADFPVRVETRARIDAGEMEELSRPQGRASGSKEIRVVDVRKKDVTKELGGDRGTKRIFKTLSEETLKQIGEEIRRGGRVVVFAGRRGIAPLTVCNDCGTPVTDQETGTPMTLHKSAEGNVFLSHRSGAMIPAGTPCRNCGGWNLVTLGIGIERVLEELEKEFPDAPLFLFTKETAPTHKSAKKLSEKFYAESGAILAGTERMLPYLTETVELAVVASIDSILSLPAWRAHEHALSILFYLRERAELCAIVETRKPEHLVMKTFASGNPLDFYRSDIEERRQYLYPPFSTFIGLSWKGSKQQVEKNRTTIENIFKDTDLVGPLPAVLESKNEWRARAVIRVPKGTWPDASLSERLRALSPDIGVTVDPDEIA